ncbi:helix-turn-helix transcriptional regulator [Mycobacterium sp.]|uniref:helix-turn-helix transcriptional regulator n=1 Tax=Mycobacterium sp. TaxID=1785 RepID=UPI002D008AD6|nr:AAA family ATPase [Mycobacterium sp.]HXB86841.1 AAA family ATPase [Mycobacterium sp.]
MRAVSGSGWPLVGRDDEIRQALAALEDDAEFRGVALVGDSGVGKSTLARTLATIAKSQGLMVRFVLGTQTGSAVALGAFYRSVTVDAPHEPAAMLAAAQQTLEGEENLVVVVDDAQWLDPLSSTLVYQLAASGAARLIVTIRSGDNVSDAVTALWKERLLLSLRIEAFTREQTGELARAVLGGAVDTRLISELQHRAAGSPLLLRGLLSAGRESGVLVRTEDGWQLRGALRADRELQDLLEFRLRSLAAEELEAVEVLAAAEVLDWEILRGLCDADAVARLERRGVVQFVADGSHTVARLYHPLLGETAMQRAGVVRSRQLNGMLAQQLRKDMRPEEQRSRLSDVRTQIQLAQFMMRSDLAPDLDVMIDAAASAMTMSNIVLAEELARFAFDRGGGLAAAVVLAEAMGWQGRGDEVEAVLGAFDPDGADELLTARWGCVRAMNLFFNCGQVEQARKILANVTDRINSEAIVSYVAAVDVLFTCFSGDIETTIETGLALCASDLPLAAVWAAVPTCWALALAGRFDDVHRVAEAGLRAAALAQPGGLPRIGLAEVMALTAIGDYPAAERARERHATGVLEADDAMRGLVHLARGALSSACAAFRDSMLAMSGGFTSVWSMPVAAWWAQAEGARGDGEAAAAALRRAEDAYGPHLAVFLPELELARAWERAAVGQTTAAQNHVVRAAQIAHHSGMYAVEMSALHTAVRFDDRSQSARLEELAATLNTPLAEAIAEHAGGLANRDGDLLDAAADRFADLGAVALAADAAAQAAHEHARTGHRGKELESSTRAHWLASQGEIRTPAVAAAARPLPITDREREIAMLVLAGLSNHQVADQLVVSVRTVEGHLYRMFANLDISSRDQLIHLLKLDWPEA